MNTTFLAQVALTIFSGIASIFVAKIHRSMDRKERERERARQEEEKERQTAELKREQEADALREGMQAMLRDRILQLFYKCRERGCAGPYDAQNMDHMYNAYHKVGGNGMITNVYQQFSKLPIEPEGAA